MFSRKFRLYLVALAIVLLSGVGLFVYHNHVEFQTFMGDHSRKMAQLNEQLQPNTTDTLASATTNTPHWSTFDKGQWNNYWSNQEPVKLSDKKPLTADDPNVKLLPQPPSEPVELSERAPQLVQTPDGRVHKILWHSKLRPGDPMPPIDSLPMDRVVTEGVEYIVPLGETADSYIDKIKLSTMYDVPLESVDSLIEEGVIPSSPEEAADDPIFDDPLFVRREDRRPLESGFVPDDIGNTSVDFVELDAKNPKFSRHIQDFLGNPNAHEPTVVEVLNMLLADPSGSNPRLAELVGYVEGGSNAQHKLDFRDTVDIYADYLDAPEISEERFETNHHPHHPSKPTEKPVTPEGEQSIELSADLQDQLMDPNSTAERLRRLQELWESDPDAARQLESDKSRPGREHLRSERLRPAEPSHDAPNSEEAER